MSNIGNSTLKEIANELKGASNVALFPHVNMDGDALGSCVALGTLLKAMGKDCRIVISEDIPDNLDFLDRGEDGEYCLTTRDLEACKGMDLSVLVDLSETKRITDRADCFLTGKNTICIDHHGTAECACDLNYIDPDAAATGQIIWELINIIIDDASNASEESRFNLDLTDESKKKIAEAIFTAITTDTGNFMYSNTQKESHEIAASLYDWGLDLNKITIEVYQSYRVERLRLSSEVISKMEIICSGKVAISYCSQEMLNRTGAKMEEAEWIISDLRAIKGVEVAILLKEEESKMVKASLRSKKSFDVAALAKEFGGGGHTRASGYTVYCTLEQAISDIKKRLMELDI